MPVAFWNYTCEKNTSASHISYQNFYISVSSQSWTPLLLLDKLLGHCVTSSRQEQTSSVRLSQVTHFLKCLSSSRTSADLICVGNVLKLYLWEEYELMTTSTSHLFYRNLYISVWKRTRGELELSSLSKKHLYMVFNSKLSGEVLCLFE